MEEHTAHSCRCAGAFHYFSVTGMLTMQTVPHHAWRTHRATQLPTVKGQPLTATRSGDGSRVKLSTPTNSGWLYETDIEACKVCGLLCGWAMHTDGTVLSNLTRQCQHGCNGCLML